MVGSPGLVVMGRLMSERSWVRISALGTRQSNFTSICCRIVLRFEKTENKWKRGQLRPGRLEILRLLHDATVHVAQIKTVYSLSLSLWLSWPFIMSQERGKFLLLAEWEHVKRFTCLHQFVCMRILNHFNSSSRHLNVYQCHRYCVGRNMNFIYELGKYMIDSHA